MERSEVSLHEVMIVLAMKSSEAWMTNKDIAAKAPSVALRTVRHHTKRLIDLGLVDVAEVFPGHRYRWSSNGVVRNKSYLIRLQKAAEIFGFSL